MKISPFFFFLTVCLWHVAALGQNTQEEFGQNRVQYHEFNWSFFRSDNFLTYFYLGGQDIGKYVIQQAEKDLEEIQQKIEYKGSGKIEILVFNDLTDLQQSNIGVDQESYNIGGLTKISGNRIFVYFDGSHQNLRKQIREGIAQVLLNDMLYGGNIQEVVQNAVLLNLPQWFSDGFISYIGEEWSIEMDNQLRDGVLSNKLKKFTRLHGKDARLVGHSLVKYISEKYGKSSIPSILYLTKLNRNLETGISFVLGKSMWNVLIEWYNYTCEQYKEHYEKRDILPDSSFIGKRLKPHLEYFNLKASPEAQYITYMSNDRGRRKLRIHNTFTGKTKTLMRFGFRSLKLQTEYQYPIYDWYPEEQKLAIIYEKKDKLYLSLYSPLTKEKEVTRITKFQRIRDVDVKDENTLVLSAINRGQSDIYTYRLDNTTTDKITNDFYDDLEASYVRLGEGREGYVFVSNRTSDTLQSEKLDTILPNGNLDVFFLKKNSTDKVAVRVTNTPYFNERLPQQWDRDHISYITSKNGIQNREKARFKSVFSHQMTYVYAYDTILVNPTSLDSLIASDTLDLIDSVVKKDIYKDVAETTPQTNYATGIIEHTVLYKDKLLVDHLYKGGRSVFVKTNFNDPYNQRTGVDYLNTPYYESLIKANAPKKSKTSKKKKEAQKPAEDTIPEVMQSHYFQSPFMFKNNNTELYKKEYGDYFILDQDLVEGSDNEVVEPIFKSTEVLPYTLRFVLTDVTSQIDNSLIFNKYQPFNPSGTSLWDAPALSPLIQFNVIDIMEDYKLTGGFRLPFDLQGSEYFALFQNFKRKIDKKMLYYRRVSNTNNISLLNAPIEAGKQVTNYWQYSLNFPLNMTKSVRTQFGYRNDRGIAKSTSQETLEAKDGYTNWLLARLEFVLDNSIEPAINVRNGMRFKVYTEYNHNLDKKNTMFTITGTDFRYYQKISRNFIWANRFAAATSIGPSKMLYYLGGVDSWLVNPADASRRFDDRTTINTENGYAFQTYATNLRGHKQNIRNGNSFALINSELRFPLISYFAIKPIKSEFLNTLQLTAFGDIGTAWEGWSPFEGEGAFQTDQIPGVPISMTIEYYRSPIVGGFGFGARAKLFGYFVRADYSWGVENGRIIKDASTERSIRILYLSLSLDF